MKIAIHQTAGVPGDPEANMCALATTARQAAGQGATLLILPELWLTGYNIGAAVRDLAQHADGPATEQVSAIARQYGIAIVYGYPERDGERIFNAARLLDADGTALANMRKLHLFGEQERHWFTPGDAFAAVVRLDAIRLGLLICYDVEFPETVRTLVLHGADVIAVPTALFEPHIFIATQMIPVRAWENNAFVAYANRCGNEAVLAYVGRSSICAPDGRVLASAGAGDALIVADVDPAAYRHQTAADNPYLRDRRPTLYDALVTQTGRNTR